MMCDNALVVFEPGILSGRFAWAWVTDRLPSGAISVVNDRGGLGTFDILFRRLDYRAVRQRLQIQLDALASSSSIVLVGHSIGGLLARAHANSLGARCAGLVFVDPSPPEQFDPAADTQYQALRLQQLLWLRAWRNVVPSTPRPADVAIAELLPERAAQDAIERLTDHRFWLNAYREARAAASCWSDAAVFPEVEQLPVAVVSSSVSTDPNSIQSAFEQRLLDSAPSNIHIPNRHASHETILYDREHSLAVSDAIAWVVKEAGP
jgi:pimeloyl-ACP methyl ester carboxylesterase